MSPHGAGLLLALGLTRSREAAKGNARGLWLVFGVRCGEPRTGVRGCFFS